MLGFLVEIPRGGYTYFLRPVSGGAATEALKLARTTEFPFKRILSYVFP